MKPVINFTDNLCRWPNGETHLVRVTSIEKGHAWVAWPVIDHGVRVFIESWVPLDWLETIDHSNYPGWPMATPPAEGWPSAPPPNLDDSEDWKK